MQAKYCQLRHLLLWRQLGLKWEPSAAFLQPQKPLFLEIGFGNGEYLARQAAERPQHNFLGIEIHWESVRRCLRRLSQQNLKNVRLLQMDVQVALGWLLPDACLDGFVALFPCPWPKRQHRKFRLFSSLFMSHLNRACKPGARGLVVTDHQGLRDFAREQVAGTGLELEVQEVPPAYNTKYERRWSGQGQQIFYELHYQRKTLPQLKRPEEAEMRTLFLEPSQFDPDTMEKQLRGRVGDIVIEYRQQLYDPRRQHWMVLTTVVEDSLSQTFWIEGVRKEEGWAIRPALGGGYLPTSGVQQALDRIAQVALGNELIGHLSEADEISIHSVANRS